MSNHGIFGRRAAIFAGTAILLATQGMAYAAEADDNNQTETVTVTGTRIPRPELDLPNPATSLNAEDIVHSGTTNITDYLKRIPALLGSLGDVETTGLNTGSTDAGSSESGLNLLNLRNLGFDRTLVLEDGQRVVGSSTGDTGVDTNTIPITLIDRVDVVTGGSSAVYGADGVTGVVNFVMKHDLEGVDARLQAGAPQDGGAERYLAAVSIGHNFDDDNGNVTLTYELGVQDRLNYTQRASTNTGTAIFFVPNPANLDGLITTLPQNIPSKIATIPVVAGTGILDDLNGDLFKGDGTPFNPGTPIDPSGQGEFNLGGDGLPAAAAFAADLNPNQHRHIAEISGHEDFSRWFHLSGEFRYSHVDTSSASEPAFWEDALITSDNPFLPTDVRNALLTNGTLGLGPGGSALGLDSQYPYNIPDFPLVEDTKRDTYRFVAGLNGDFPLAGIFHDAKYDLHFVYGQTDVDDAVEHDLVADRFAAAMDVVNGPNGPTCRTNLDPSAVPADLSALPFGLPPVYDFVLQFPSSGFGTSFTPGPNSGCAPINPFSTTANNAAGLAFAFPTVHNSGILTQTDLNGAVSFDFPQFKDDFGFGGPVSVVVGGEYRKETSASMSPAISLTPGLFFDAGSQPVKGAFDVKELFGEVSVPILAGLPFADELTLDLAGRVSDYSTAGTDETWKVGLVYAPIPDVKFRATDAVAVRAPNVGELFAPQQSLFEGIDDPCDQQYIHQGTANRVANCQALVGAIDPGYVAGTSTTQNALTVPTLIGGNPNLAPETARTFTVGVVLQPSFLPGFAATVDYYRVNITNAIEAPSAQDVANQCVDLSTINNPFCAQITRRATDAGTGNPAGGISQASSTQINVASFYTAGQDFTVTYHSDLEDYFGEDSGTLDLHLIGNHLDKIATTPLPGEAQTDSSGTSGSPFWQLDIDAVWHIDRFTFDYNWQWYTGVLNFSRQTVESTPNIIAPNLLHTADQNLHSISLAYDVTDNLNIYTGIDNLFYQKPSPNDATVGIPVSPVGRFFYGGIRFKTDDVMDALGLN